jgi:deoxyribonuclease V
MIACVDVQYDESATGAATARAAVVAFEAWDASVPLVTHVVTVRDIQPYTPGSFYLRELPCIRAALATLDALPEVVIVDGHAWVGVGVPGLGARLLEAEPGLRTVVGVAKTRFRDAPVTPVLRGASTKPLHVDEAGVAIDAPSRVASMHGPFRIPTLLRLVDQLCRGSSGTILVKSSPDDD